MSNKNKRKVVLTGRDRKLFYYLFRYKTVSLSDVQKVFFKDAHYSATTRRLRLLERAKLIQKDVIMDDEKRIISLFSLTSKGLIELQKLGFIVTRKQLKSNYPGHDLALLKLVRSISKLKMVNKIITENELLSLELYLKDESLNEFVSLKPDAVLMLKVKNAYFSVVLEFEQNGKSASRWKQKLIQYYQSSSVDAVFYFCESQSILNKLLEIDRNIATTEKRKIFFALSSSVTSETQKVTLTNSVCNTFNLN